ncbi:hypothetical protein GE061_007555 [Apolygus lucorum]|uniref:Uncharacterized protein n=1 Tax=Apolygus lucorum TaxID=248454 RepID=A0A8S9WTL0_APOLU|nr:hypothetical protein GE061_007555 [Apolygus lucorum]
MFHAIALTCVVWSLYVLIHRTAEEIQYGLLEWPFWTKLIVVAIGFTGGVVFMYIQCKAYMQICQRWKAFNRVIYVQKVGRLGDGPVSLERFNDWIQDKVEAVGMPELGRYQNQTPKLKRRYKRQETRR